MSVKAPKSMRHWLSRATSRDERVGDAVWSGPALVDAAEGSAADDVTRLRTVAFEVAQATRAGEPDALRALAVFLARTPAVGAFDDATLTNVLSALQFASMLPEETRADWLPPARGVTRTVELGLKSREALREQTDGFLWALVNQQLAGDWLEQDYGNVLSASVASPELRDELIGQLRTQEHLIGIVAGGEEFPCVPA